MYARISQNYAKNLNYVVIEANSYRECLDLLNLRVMENFDKTGKIFQPTELKVGKDIKIFSEKEITTIKQLVASPRPFSLDELATIIVESYHAGMTWQYKIRNILSENISTATSIVYPREDKSEYKIVPMSKNLINLPSEYKKSYIETNYENVDGILIKKGKEKYNKELTDEEYNNHPFWCSVITDPAIRREFKKIMNEYKKTKNKKEKEKTLSVSLNIGKLKTSQELPIILCNSLYQNNHHISGNIGLNQKTYFLLLLPKKKSQYRNNYEPGIINATKIILHPAN